VVSYLLSSIRSSSASNSIVEQGLWKPGCVVTGGNSNPNHSLAGPGDEVSWLASLGRSANCPQDHELSLCDVLLEKSLVSG
jgi:hypothetical protein